MTELEDRLEALRSRPSDECVSDYQMDLLVTGDLVGSEASDVRTRIAACQHCQHRLEVLKALQNEFKHRPTPVWLGRKKARRWLGAAMTVTAAAAVALLLFRPEAKNPASIRLKGSDSFRYVIVRPDGTVRGDQASGIAAPGDELQWRFRVSDNRYVAVLSRDPIGQILVYYPDGPEAALVEGGSEQPLPLALRLDHTVGEEQIYGLICAEPVQLEPIRQRLQAGDTTSPEHCAVRHYTLTKQEGP
ncbi:MAG: hypothetical protein WBM46_10985 [Polyangiales bacterium]|jgi:hypothetical protein